MDEDELQLPTTPRGQYTPSTPWLNKKDAAGNLPIGIEVEDEFLQVLRGKLEGARLNAEGEPPNLYLLFGFASQAGLATSSL